MVSNKFEGSPNLFEDCDSKFEMVGRLNQLSSLRSGKSSPQMSTLKYLGDPRNQLHAARKYLKVLGFSSLHTASNSSVELHSQDEEVMIALGSNVGIRLHNCKEALKLMRNSGIHITRHACLYETAPTNVTD